MPTSFLRKMSKIYYEEDSLLNKCCWEKWLPICKKLKLDPCLSPCTSIQDFNMRPEMLKLVQEGAGNNLELVGIGTPQ
jgi:hypothetical protein